MAKHVKLVSSVIIDDDLAAIGTNLNELGKPYERDSIWLRLEGPDGPVSRARFVTFIGRKNANDISVRSRKPLGESIRQVPIRAANDIEVQVPREGVEDVQRSIRRRTIDDDHPKRPIRLIAE